MLLLVESSRWCCRHLGPDSTQRAENPAPSLWPRASRPAPVERASPRRGVPMRVGPSSDGRQARRSPHWTGGRPAPWSPARHLVVAFRFSPLGRERCWWLRVTGCPCVFSFRFAYGQPFRPGSLDFEIRHLHAHATPRGARNTHPWPPGAAWAHRRHLREPHRAPPRSRPQARPPTAAATRNPARCGAKLPL